MYYTLARVEKPKDENDLDVRFRPMHISGVPTSYGFSAKITGFQKLYRSVDEWVFG